MSPRLSARWARARVRAAAKASKLLAGPVVGALPRSCLNSLDEELLSPDTRQLVADRHVLVPPTLVEYPLPPDLSPAFRRTKAFDAVVLHRLREAVVSPHTGVAWTPDGRVLVETIGSQDRLMVWGEALAPMLLPVGPAVTGPVVASHSPNYAHWLLDSVPALLRAMEWEPAVTLLLPQETPRFVAETLHRLLGDDVTARVRREAGPVPVSDLIVSPAPAEASFVHPDSVRRLRAAFRPEAPADRARRARIYVSRRASTRRALANEGDVEAVMRAAGFEVVRTEELSFVEQVQRFRTAAVVVAPHGAGLANLVWMDAPGHVHELHPVGYFNDSMARLGAQLGLGYSCQFARATAGGAVVDLDELALAVSRLPDHALAG